MNENTSEEKIRWSVSRLTKTDLYIIRPHLAEKRLLLHADQEYLLASAWPGATLHLLRPAVRDRTVEASAIILHPDYLVDISSIAACFKDYGAHALHYIFHLVDPRQNSPYTLLGNTVNQFFDDCLQGESGYRESLLEAFRADALNFLTAERLQQVYFDAVRLHYDNIREVIDRQFPAQSPPVSAKTGILEPSFLCPELGIQGRMDFLTFGPQTADGGTPDPVPCASLIELKSGKWDEFARRHKISHFIQVQLYAELLHRNQGIPKEKIRSYLLYSRYPLLVDEPQQERAVRQAFRIRNQIVGYLHDIVAGRAETLFTSTNVDSISEATGKLWLQYDKPRLSTIVKTITGASAAMRNWFFEQLRFILTEDEIARTGGSASCGTECGTASLWRCSVTQKRSDGEIIAPLLPVETDTGKRGIAGIGFRILSRQEESGSPNFRKGDDVLFYAGDADTTDAASQLIFRGNIADITPDTLHVRLRQPLNPVFFDLYKKQKFICEHDSVNNITAMQCRTLFQMLSAPLRWREILIEQEMPREMDIASKIVPKEYGSQQEQVSGLIDRMIRTADYFLLVGPPGTGKTSIVLRELVRRLYHERKETLLLLSYTHRAVDEICRSLESIPDTDYLRFGHSLHCHPDFHDRLLTRQIDNCTCRRQLGNIIDRCRIFVGTSASLHVHHNIFELKRFDTIIVDEASQLLEYQIIELLTHARRFILIGDHKQLPAVTRQPDGTSLFERLYRHALRNAPDRIGTLLFQGRMHPDIARFSNTLFYENRLRPIPLPHQVQTTLYPLCEMAGQPNTSSMASRRFGFIDVPAPDPRGRKYNLGEAEAVARLAGEIIRLNLANGFAINDMTLGIIVPYRSQIAAIRQSLATLRIEDADKINIDTVERYQGSQRDIIIYSATVSTPLQLEQVSVCQEMEGITVDRKLNVIITRARQQLFIVGNRALLVTNPIYRRLIEGMED